MINGLYAYFGSNNFKVYANYADLNFLGNWDPASGYVAAGSQAVAYANATYLCIRDNTNAIPSASTNATSPFKWSPLILVSANVPSAISNVVISGNTAGSTDNINGALILAGGNNVTLSQQSNTISIIAAAGGGGGGGAVISAGTNSQNTGTVSFGNSNGVSFGLATNGKMTASVQTNYQTPGPYLTTAMQSNAVTLSNINVSAANASANLSNLAFGNAGGVTFLLVGSTVVATVETDYQPAGPYLTTAMQSNAATISNINVSAGTTSSNLSSVNFVNSNGVSFGLGTGASAGQVTATVATNYQTQGAYLTTADLSQNSSKYAGTAGAITGGSITVDTSGVSVNLPAYLTTAAQSTQTLQFTLGGNVATTNSSQVANGGFILAGGNNVTLQQSNNTLSFSVGNYITTADLSQNSSKYAGTNAAITGGSITVNTSGVSINLPAYLTTAMQSNAVTLSNINISGGSTSSNISAVTFSNANGVSFGLGTGASAGVVTASVNPGVANINLSAGTTSTNAAAFSFLNSNGVSFGLGTGASAGQVTATVQTNFLTTAAQSTQTLQFTLGGNVATTNSSQIANGGFILAGGNNVTIQQSNNTVSISVGNYITTADLSQNSSKYAGTNGAITGGSITVNTSGVSVNLPAYLTTAAQSTQTLQFTLGGNVATTNSSQVANGGFILAGGNNLTIQQSNNTLSFSVGNYITTADLSQNSSKYAGTNGAITGGSITVNTSGVSVNLPAYLTTAMQSNAATISNINVSAGSTSTNASAFSFVDSNGVSFGLGTGASVGRITATVATNYQSQGAYLTTAAQSTQTLQFTLGGNVATTNSSQVANGGYILAGGNNLTIQQSNNTLSFSVGNYITTAAQSTQTLLFSLSGNTATTNSSQIANGGYALAGGNNVTLQQSNNTVSISVGNYITTADLSQNSSKYAGINGAITGGSITVNTSGVSVNLPAYITTAAQSTQTLQFTLGGNVATTNSSQIANGGFILAGGNNLTIQQSNNTVSLSVGNYITTADLSQNSSNYAGAGETVGTIAGTDLAMTVNTAGVSIAYPKWITTAALSSQTLALSLGGNSATTNSSQIINGGYVLAGGANVTIQQSNNTISISAAAAAAAPINFSAGTTSNNIGSVVFSNSNNLLFGLSGSTITASFNNIDIGMSTNGNTAGTTGTFDGGGLQYVFAGTNGITLSQSSNGASVTLSIVGPGDPYCGYLEPMSMTNTAVFGPAAGNWYFAPFEVPQKMSGGRLNLLHINTSTASLFIDITGASYVSGSTGTLQQSYTYSKAVALYSQGAGTNSTRLESIWSNSFSFGWSKDVRVSLSNASNINITVAHSLSYISEIGSNGAYTLNQFASAISTTVANSSTASNQFTNAGSSIRNMLSNSIIEPIGFNTTIAPGAYWLAFAWSSTRATASTGGLLGSAPDFSVSSEVGISRLVLESAFRNWGSTVTTARSHIMPYGLYTGAANMAPPATLAFSSDLSSIASAWVPYFNFQNQGITK